MQAGTVAQWFRRLTVVRETWVQFRFVATEVYSRFYYYRCAVQVLMYLCIH